MLRCECDRCHSAMDVPQIMMPFISNPQASKPEFMIFRSEEGKQMNQLHLCPLCEEHFKLFLKEIDK